VLVSLHARHGYGDPHGAPVPGVPEESPRVNLRASALSTADGLWIHNLAAAVQQAGGVLELAAQVADLRHGLVHIKVADGRAPHRGCPAPLLARAVPAFRALGIHVAFWQWVYAVYPGGDGTTTVKYCEEQAQTLARICTEHGVRIAVANVEGDGHWSMSPWGPKGRATRARWPLDYAAELDARMDAYSMELRHLLGEGACLGISTHGLPSSQMLPWARMTDPLRWDVVMPQLYWRRGRTWSGLVERAVEEWLAYGVTRERLRITGGAWEPEHVAGIPAMRAAVAEQAEQGACQPGIDWWALDKAEARHLTALRRD
jgi:hypothetical protein